MEIVNILFFFRACSKKHLFFLAIGKGFSSLFFPHTNSRHKKPPPFFFRFPRKLVALSFPPNSAGFPFLPWLDLIRSFFPPFFKNKELFSVTLLLLFKNF